MRSRRVFAYDSPLPHPAGDQTRLSEKVPDIPIAGIRENTSGAMSHTLVSNDQPTSSAARLALCGVAATVHVFAGLPRFAKNNPCKSAAFRRMPAFFMA